MNRVLRKSLLVAWGLPQEVCGAFYAALGLLAGATVRRAHNALVLDNPLQRRYGFGSGIALGHFIHIGGPASTQERGHTVGEHEEQHTRQSEVLGPLYLPLHLASMIAGLLGPGHHIHAEWAFLEKGPQEDPPRPWPWAPK